MSIIKTTLFWLYELSLNLLHLRMKPITRVHDDINLIEILTETAKTEVAAFITLFNDKGRYIFFKKDIISMHLKT